MVENIDLRVKRVIELFYNRAFRHIKDKNGSIEFTCDEYLAKEISTMDTNLSGMKSGDKVLLKLRSDDESFVVTTGLYNSVIVLISVDRTKVLLTHLIKSKVKVFRYVDNNEVEFIM